MWSEKKKERAINTLITYSKPHRSWFVRGALATVGVVFFRLAMPWPLRGVIEVIFPGGSRGGLLVDRLPDWGDPVLLLGGFYILLAFGLGISEMIQRVNLMRFASHTVHDMRAAAVRGATGRPFHERGASGDFITRIIGDSARIKAGLSGIFVHGLQNGLLFLAVCAVLVYISVQLGLIFIAAGLIAIYIGLRASNPVAKAASKQRRKEGDYATALQEGLDGSGLDLQLKEINQSSARKEVRTTKIIARSSLYVHLVLAAAVGLGLWFGALGVRSGSIAPGELFLFIAYALTVHRRMVQVGRQTARTGKVMACVDRIAAFIHDANPVRVLISDTTLSVPLESGLRFEGVKLYSAKGKKGRPRFRLKDLTIRPRSRVAVLGGIGAGKSSLLRLLAGAESPDKGRIFWDGKEALNGFLSSRVAYLPQDPIFPAVRLWNILGLRGPEALSAEQEETLRLIGARNVIQGFPEGLQKKVGSTSISRNEARLMRLAGILLGDMSSVWVLDNPVQGLRRTKARRCLDEILKKSSDRTLVVALSEPIDLNRFDRVLVLRNGEIHFDGTPAEWNERKHVKQKALQIPVA